MAFELLRRPLEFGDSADYASIRQQTRAIPLGKIVEIVLIDRERSQIHEVGDLQPSGDHAEPQAARRYFPQQES